MTRANYSNLAVAMPHHLIQENVSLRNLTSFKVGGPARYYAEPSNLDEIREVLKWVKATSTPLFLLGKGTNLVISDAGFPGLVLHLGKRFGAMRIEGNQVFCEAGCLLHTAVVQSVDAGLAGIENLGGIPGTLGGGAFINAGAFDQELCQVITKVTSLDMDGIFKVRDNAQCGFSYRHSSLMGLPEVIVGVEIQLHAGNKEELRAQMNTILARRKEKQPIELPNAGSMFKRPPGKFAGALIESSGLKGFRVGDAAVSEKHANFVVNLGKATATDIWNLTEQVIAKVKVDHGVTLEREVIFIGSFA